jgi:hypothetical protein
MFAFMAGLNDEVNVHRDIEKATFMTQAARQPAVHQKADAAIGSVQPWPAPRMPVSP